MSKYFLPLVISLFSFLSLPSFTTAFTFSYGITPDDVPHPILHYSGCGREKPSYICDQFNYMSESEKEKLDEVILRLRDEFKGPTPCDGNVGTVEVDEDGKEMDGSGKGYEVGVAIVKKMQREYSDVGRFATKIYNNWGIGEKRCNNGILMFLSIEDRELFIATGSATRQRLSDYRAKEVIENMKPFLRKSLYAQAITSALLDIEVYLKQEELASDDDGTDSWIGWLIFLTPLGLLLLKSEHDKYKEHKRFRVLAEKLKRLENDRDRLRDNEYQITSCPICFQDLIFGEQDNEVAADTQNRLPQFPLMPQNESFWKYLSDGVLNKLSSAYHFIETQLHRAYHMVFKNGHNESDNPYQNLPQDISDIALATSSRNERRAFAIPCGHIFCEGCIRTWLKSNSTCPVCRKPLDFDVGATTNTIPVATTNETRRGVLSRVDGRNSVMARISEELLWQDLRYRMWRMHSLYPRYVTPTMYHQFDVNPSHTYLTQHEHFIAEQNRALNNNNIDRNSANDRTRSGFRQGSTGSKGGYGGRSFGGGFASGGAGGGW